MPASTGTAGTPPGKSELMHELSLAQNIVEIVEAAVPPESDPRASTIRIRVGELAGVVTDSLLFCFEAITQGTRFEHSRLELIPVAITARCNTCGAINRIVDSTFVCVECSGTGLSLLSGRELQVIEIELQDSEE